MTIQLAVVILFSVSLSAFAQITLKYGMSSPHMLATLQSGTTSKIIIAVLTTPHVVGGLAMYALGAVAWLFVLAKLDVTTAYPFVGLGFILTMLLGALILGEQLTPYKVAGTFLVVAGIILVAR